MRPPTRHIESHRYTPRTGIGHEDLRALVLDSAKEGVVEVEVTVPLSDGKALQRLENRSTVLEREYPEDGKTVKMRVKIGQRQLDQLRSGSPGLRVK